MQTKIQTAISTSEEDYVNMLLQVMSKWYSKPREGMHVSDIILCPRQKVFREIQPKPITVKDVSMFSSGRSVHEAIQLLFLSNRGRFEKEKYIEHENIIGSMDIYDHKKNVPIEFKTIRAAKIEKPKAFHEEQLRYYMSMIGANTGYILYQCLMHFENEPFRIFKVKMTESQREIQLKKLVDETTSLQSALISKDPSLARHVFDDHELNWLCKECPYSLKCKVMRDKDQEY